MKPALALVGATLLAGVRAPISLVEAVRGGRTSDEWARGAGVTFGAGIDTLAKVLELWSKREIVPSDVFDQLTDELKGRAGRLAGVWHTTFVQAVYESLFRAINEGHSLQEWLPHVQQMLDGFGAAGGERLYSGEKWSAWYADLVYRNANAAAYAGGKYAEMFSQEWMVLAPFWLYSAIDDDRVRETHLALDGKVFRKDDVTARRFLPPWSHNCFPAETRIVGAVDGGTRVAYSGPVVALVTGRGQELTLTVNHPVLTTRGWVAAKDLRQGDDVFADDPNIEGRSASRRLLEGASLVPRPERDAVAAVGVDFDHRPAGARQIFESLGATGERATLRKRPEDFHGDARSFNGDVDAVLPLGPLTPRRKTESPKFARDLRLEATKTVQAYREGARGFLHLLERLLSAAGGFPGAPQLAFDGSAIGLHGLPFNGLRFGLAPKGNPSFTQRDRQRSAPDAGPVRDALEALSVRVRSEQRVVQEGGAALGVSKSASLGGFATRLRRVEVREFRGDVYDFATAHGAMLANGIVISNCRCTAIELDVDDLKAGEYAVTHGSSIDVAPEPGWDADRVAALVPDALRKVA